MQEHFLYSVQFSSVQSLSRVWLFATPWIAALQASLSITISRSSLRLTSIESVMPSSHLILGRPLLLLPPIPVNSLHEVANVIFSILHLHYYKTLFFSWGGRQSQPLVREQQSYLHTSFKVLLSSWRCKQQRTPDLFLFCLIPTVYF